MQILGPAKTSGFVGLRRSKEAGGCFSAKKNGAKRTLHIGGHAKTSGFVGLRRSKEAGGCFLQRKTEQSELCSDVAGETRLEHATVGFGDRCSTN